MDISINDGLSTRQLEIQNLETEQLNRLIAIVGEETLVSIDRAMVNRYLASDLDRSEAKPVEDALVLNKEHLRSAVRALRP